MHRPYKTRAGGCTVTVFVPYDCNNNCPFCVNNLASAKGDRKVEVKDLVEIIDRLL